LLLKKDAPKSWATFQKTVQGKHPLGEWAKSGANPTIVSYNASAVKIYNATSSLVRLENFFIQFEKTL
jgi:hypothetical protein